MLSFSITYNASRKGEVNEALKRYAAFQYSNSYVNICVVMRTICLEKNLFISAHDFNYSYYTCMDNLLFIFTSTLKVTELIQNEIDVIYRRICVVYLCIHRQPIGRNQFVWKLSARTKSILTYFYRSSARH